MAIALANGGDFVGIVGMLFINSTISFIEENNAGNVAAALMAGLTPKTKVLTTIGNFSICSIAIGMIIEIIVMYSIQKRAYRSEIDNLLVLLIGGIPIAMATVLSVTLAIGSHRLSHRGIGEMAGMDVLCSDKTGTLTLNKLTVDKKHD
ncbi:hypothetical protein Ddye_010712 [Dipteronia dyeriana]|uniref:Uncharacterized protein n=1 Tax=Dipteronia dyeriana TaxID=168575 RepID=A0AAD9XDR1_9ROSI|nr:hypothetical protein Ddye_010712 [Dipteronia dyeriana]